ncbi:MAG: hypothetical protein O7C75_07435 [Verrucomicrobia bacterium]|nr:hypothetical protein [Verrucomicrobiota bacterium]
MQQNHDLKKRHYQIVGEILSKNWEWVVLTLAALLVFLRVPRILLEGRFWAEDGVLYFRQAYISGNDLGTFLSSEVGYYSLINRIIGYVSGNWLPLDYAPLLHCWVAFFFLLLPVLILLFSKLPGIETSWQKLLGIGLVLFVTPNLETWLSLALSQFHNGLAVALILVSKSDRRWMRWIRYFTLIVAGLNSPFPCFFVPFFWLIWIINRDSEKLLECILLSVFTLIQAWVVISLPDSGLRPLFLSLSFLPYALIVKQFLLAFGGWSFADGHVSELRRIFLENYWLFSWVVPAVYGAIICLIVRYKDKVAGFLFFSGIFVLILSVIGDLGMPNPEARIIYLDVIIGGRYFFVPNMLFFLSLLVLSSNERGIWDKAISLTIKGLLVWVIVVGIFNYNPNSKYAEDFFVGPSWKEEIAKWREDPSYLVHIWPIRKTLQLPPLEQP